MVAPGREAVIVVRRPLADRPRLQGLAGRDAPRRPHRAGGARRADAVPALDPTEVEDLLLGCGLPGGEQGFNLARIVAVQLGMDTLPGATVTRYCSSSLQTARMAAHAIRAGEGDVFLAAGVETVSRFAKGSSDNLPGTHNPLFADAEARTAEVAAAGGDRVERPARRRPAPRRLHRDGADRGERGAGRGRDPRGDGPLRRALAAAGGRRSAERLLGARDHPGDAARRHGGGARRRPARRAPPTRRSPSLKPVFRPDGRITAGNACPLNDGAAALVVMSARARRGAGDHPARAHRLHRRHRALARDHGPRAGRGVGAGAGPRRAGDRRRRPRRDQRGLRRPGPPVGTGGWGSDDSRRSSTSTAARSPSATRSA